MTLEWSSQQRHTASMAGDSETHLRDRDENTNIIRQPFLIGVSGGTASGKVGILASLSSDLRALTWSHLELNDCTVWRRPAVDRVALATRRLIDSCIICLTASAGLA